MQVVSHMAFAGGIAALAGVGPQEIAALSVGAVFPDMMDSILAGESREVWKGLHRTVSHWPVLYPVIFGFVLFSGVAVPDSVFRLVCAFLTGALIHISCDFLTPMGIPLYPPFTKRASLKLIRTGSVYDYAFGFTPMLAYGLVVMQQSI